MKKIFTLSLLLASCVFAQAQDYSITWQVDMSGVTGFTTPEVNGTFNNWCGNCFQMTDANGDNIWEGTTTLPAGTYEYKYSYDNWGGQESLTPGDACTLTTGQFTNRTLTVTGDAVLPVVCWESCSPCGVAPSNGVVTFQLDMSQFVGSFGAPEVNGTFNNWCGNCAAMTDANGDNIWDISITLPIGSYEYKFSYDNWAGQESLTDGSACTVTNGSFVNRVITVTGDSVLNAVCWNSCNLCGSGVEELSANHVRVFPNPTNGNMTLQTDLSLPVTIQVFDISGKLVSTQRMASSIQQMDMSHLPKGAYSVRLFNDKQSVKEVVLVQ